MSDPVVCKKDGLTYERHALIAREGDRGYYSNRALIDYMRPTTNPRAELQSDNKDKLGIFFCPITCDLMRDPVIDPESYTFERSAIADWIQQHGTSPITRKPLRVSQLYDNTTLFRVLYREIHQVKHDNSSCYSDEIQAWRRDVANFNYLTQPIVTTRSSSRGLDQETSTTAHPARMRVDYNGRWRNRNKNAVTILGLVMVGLLFGIFAFLAFPQVAIWCVGAFAVIALAVGTSERLYVII